MRRALLAPFIVIVLMLALVAKAPPAVAATGGGPRSTSPCNSFVEIADVSTWQGAIDWDAYATQRPGAIIKLGGADGGLYTDGRATANVFGATNAGVLWGGYYFADPAPGNAEIQARHFISVGGGRGTLPDFLDLEYNRHGMSGAQLDQWALDFATEYHRQVAHLLDVYGGAYFAGWGNDPALPATFGLWLPAYLAGYNENPNPCAIGSPALPNAFGAKGWDLWQFTSSNTSAGIAGHIDMNVVPPEVWAEWTGGTVQPDPGSPVPASPDELVWGPGSRGAKVLQIQTIVGAAPDGVYGPETVAKVRQWQTFLGVPADGVWGPQTEHETVALFDAIAALGAGEPSPFPEPAPEPAPDVPLVLRPTIRQGARGGDVCDAQALLDDNGYGLTIDCDFGPATNHVVRDFQTSKGLTPDGIIGRDTWAELGQQAA